MPDLKGYAAAQAAWERKEPDYWDDDGWCECEACKGDGTVYGGEPCNFCGGCGGWDEDGNNINHDDYTQREKDRAEDAKACAAADRYYERMEK